MKNSTKTQKYGVGDVIKVDSVGVQEVLLITSCMPEKDPRFYVTLSEEGNIATIWPGIIEEKVGFIDVKEIIFERLKEYAGS